MRLALKILDWLFNNWLSPLSPLLGLLQSLFLVDNIILIIFLLLIIIRWWPNLLVNCSENWNLNCRRRWWWSWVGIKCKIHTVTKLVNQTYDGNWTYKYKKYQLVDIRYQTTEMLKQSLPVIQIWTLICFLFIYLPLCEGSTSEKADLEISKKQLPGAAVAGEIQVFCSKLNFLLKFGVERVANRPKGFRAEARIWQNKFYWGTPVFASITSLQIKVRKT